MTLLIVLLSHWHHFNIGCSGDNSVLCDGVKKSLPLSVA